MSITSRQLKLGQLDQLRQKAKTLENQAANASTLIEIRNSAIKSDLAKLDIDGILQASKDLHAAVTDLRANKAEYDALHAELYD